MLDKQFIDNLTNLYESIFEESVVDSKEFLIFVRGNDPHPLRIKVEDFIEEQAELLYSQPYNSVAGEIVWKKIVVIHELDTLITNYIEENYV